MRSGDHLYFEDTGPRPDFKALRKAVSESLYAGAPEALDAMIGALERVVFEASRLGRETPAARDARVILAAVNGEG